MAAGFAQCDWVQLDWVQNDCGQAHPVGVLTRLWSGGHGTRRVGSFAGKSGSPGSHPVGILTRLWSGGHGARRVGSFAGKGALDEVTPELELEARGGYPGPRVSDRIKRFRKGLPEVDEDQLEPEVQPPETVQPPSLDLSSLLELEARLAGLAAVGFDDLLLQLDLLDRIERLKEDEDLLVLLALSV